MERYGFIAARLLISIIFLLNWLDIIGQTLRCTRWPRMESP
jgi:hypothetical protein